MALKILQKSEKQQKEQNTEIMNEINILRKIDHPNIIKIYECL